MFAHTHTVSYFETDRMGITHHSNYIRWMEDARVAFLKEAGMPYEKFEELGIISPVVAVNADYKNTTTFADVIDIEVEILKYNGIKLEIGYTMKKQHTDIVVCKATSGHCFIFNNKMISLKKDFPEVDKILRSSMQTESGA